MQRYALVVKDHNGKVIQIHECYRVHVPEKLMEALDEGYRVTVREL